MNMERKFDELAIIFSSVLGCFLIYYFILYSMIISRTTENYALYIDTLLICGIGIGISTFTTIYFWKKVSCRKKQGIWTHNVCTTEK